MLGNGQAGGFWQGVCVVVVLLSGFASPTCKPLPCQLSQSEHRGCTHSSTGTLPQIPHCWGRGSSSTPGLFVLR